MINIDSFLYRDYTFPMPTVLRKGPYRFYFHSHEPNEPAHIHVDRDNFSAKFWLDPVHLARNLGFRPHELHRLEDTVIENNHQFLEEYNGYFSTGRR